MPPRAPHPPLTDGIVTLRPSDERDLEAIGRGIRDPEVVRWFGPPEGTASEILALNRRRWTEGSPTLSICDADGTFAGLAWVNASPEDAGAGSVGYWLLPGARGRGLATRAVRLLAAWAMRDLGMTRLRLVTQRGNVRSEAVAERSGFRRVGLLPGSARVDGRPIDHILFERTSPTMEAGAADDTRAILVTGVFGAGKSTVAEEIAELLEGSQPPFAAIDLDWLAWSNARGAGHDEHELLRANLASVVANDRAAGVRRFVLAGSVADAAMLDAIRAAVGGQVRVVRLTAPLPVIEDRLRAAPTAGRADDLERARAWLAAGTGEGLEDGVVDNTGPVRATALAVLAAAAWTIEPSHDGPRGGHRAA